MIFQLIQYGKPVFFALVVSKLDGQDYFLYIQFAPKNHIDSQLPDYSVTSDRIMDGIDIEYRINFRQRALLPVVDLGRILSVTSE